VALAEVITRIVVFGCAFLVVFGMVAKIKGRHFSSECLDLVALLCLAILAVLVDKEHRVLLAKRLKRAKIIIALK
jgi:hypothetical protein